MPDEKKKKKHFWHHGVRFIWTSRGGGYLQPNVTHSADGATLSDVHCKCREGLRYPRARARARTPTYTSHHAQRYNDKRHVVSVFQYTWGYIGSAPRVPLME